MRQMDAAAMHEVLKSGGVVLTATRRLASALRREHDARRMAEGALAWEDVTLRTLRVWVVGQWESWIEAAGSASGGSGLPGRVLTSRQALALWERVVAEDTPPGMLNPQGIAELAQEAWHRLLAWRVDPGAVNPEGTEGRVFARWLERYRALLDREGWLDGEALSERLAEVFAAGGLSVPGQVVLAGFDELNPQQQHLLETLSQCGAEVSLFTPAPPETSHKVRLGLPNRESELRAVARWAKQTLDSGAPVRLGVVIPELESLRVQVERIFTEELAPTAVLPEGSPAALPFNLSAGAMLSEYALPALALALLEMTPGETSPETRTALLLSPALEGAESERMARAALEHRLRERGGPAPTPSTIAALAGQSGRVWHAPRLAAVLARWSSLVRSQSRVQAPSAWGHHFAQVLSTLGWPGERTLDSEGYQSVQKWQQLAPEMAALDPVLPTVSRAEALGWLRRIAEETMYQPESSEAPVQVLGTLEAGGLAFSHLWVLGMDDERWPPSPRPNPLLPASLQRRLHMPHGSARRELERAERETSRLLTAAPEVWVSYPLREGERMLRPSPLITPLHAVAPEPWMLDAHPPLWKILAGCARLERVEGDRPPPVPHHAHVRGGSSLFRDQSACPFRAFARHRLLARTPEEPGEGVDPSQRGQLVHDALAVFWQTVESQHALLALDAPALKGLLETAVDTALNRFLEHRPEAPGRRLLALERERTLIVLEELLALERQRAPFRVIEVEKAYTFHIGGIETSGRMDRVDEVAAGGRVILDVKTGSDVKINAWIGERPDEPQLPLYCVGSGYDLAGVAFAQVRRGNAGFIGLAREEALYPGAREPGSLARNRLYQGRTPPVSLAALLEEWRGVLETLGENFRAGEAAVAPKKRPETCRMCDLGPLCRVDEVLPDWGAEAEESAAEERDG